MFEFSYDGALNEKVFSASGFRKLIFRNHAFAFPNAAPGVAAFSRLMRFGKTRLRFW